MVERAALEMRCTPKVYRGFESPTFRNTKEKSVCPSSLEQADFSFVLQGCRRQTLGITQQSPTCKDAVGRLWGLRSNPPLARMPSADFGDYVAIPHLQGASGSLLGFRGDIAVWQYRCPRIPFFSICLSKFT